MIVDDQSTNMMKNEGGGLLGIQNTGKVNQPTNGIAESQVLIDLESNTSMIKDDNNKIDDNVRKLLEGNHNKDENVFDTKMQDDVNDNMI